MEGFDESQLNKFKSQKSDIDGGNVIIKQILNEFKMMSGDLQKGVESIQAKYSSELQNPFIVELLKEV